MADNWIDFFLSQYRLVGLIWVLLFMVLGLIHYLVKKYTYRYLFGLVLSLFFVLAGVLRTVSLYPTDFFVVNEQVQCYRGVVVDTPKIKPSVVEYRLRNSESSAQILLTVPIDSTSVTYNYGDELAFYGKITRPANPTSSSSFNYRNYIARKQIKGVCYVDSGALVRLGHSSSLGWLESIYNYRMLLLHKLQSVGLDGDVLSIVSALTLGVKNELSRQLKDSFSLAGVSHVLALSGLHIGLLFALSQFVFLRLFFRFRHRKVFALLGSLSVLALFALFVGGSPSVVRSVLLFGLLGVSTSLNKKGNSVNSLALVALIMLFYNPNWLFDVGFQLSFIAVGAILIFTTPICSWYQARTKLGHYVWSSIVVSVVAQLATAPLVAYYFSIFPVYFILANLVVIPLVSILLYLLIILVLTLNFTFISEGIAQVVRFITQQLIDFVEWVSLLRGASIQQIYVYPYEFFLVGVLALMSYAVLKSRKAMSLLGFLGVILLTLGLRVAFLIHDRPVDKFSVELMNNRLVVTCYNQRAQVYVLLSDSTQTPQKMERKHQKEWGNQHYKEVKYIKEKYASDALFWDKSVMYYKGTCIALLSKLKEDQLGVIPSHFDYLYLDQFTRSDLASAIHAHEPKGVIVHAFLDESRKKEVKQLCQKNNVDFLTLKSKGCIEFLL